MLAEQGRTAAAAGTTVTIAVLARAIGEGERNDDSAGAAD
jgi:hypothetical protein